MKVAITIPSLFFMIFTPTIAAPTQRESNIKNMSINPRGRLEYPVYYCKRDFFDDGFEHSSVCKQIYLSPGECRYVGQDYNNRIKSYMVGGGMCCAFYDDWNCQGIMFKATSMREKTLPYRFRGRISSIRCQSSCDRL